MGVTEDLHPKAVLWIQQVLFHDNRSVKKAELSFWFSTVRYKRRCRPEFGFLIQLHSLFRFRYIDVPSWWEDWEVP